MRRIIYGAMTALGRRARQERGAVLVVVAISMIALLSAVALAVDVGMLMSAKAEAQTVADAAALAGAGVLRDTNGDSAQAHDAAVSWVANNMVTGESVAVLEGDVEVVPDEWTVRVRVNRTRDRGNAVPTFFARIFGVAEVDLRTRAGAWAAPASTVEGGTGAACPLPLALLDEFDDADGNGEWDPGEPVTGWDAADHGKLIKLKLHPSGGPGPMGGADGPPVDYNIDYCSEAGTDASWRCWWRNEDDDTGNQVLSPRILGTDCGPPISVGDDILSSPGNRQSLVIDEFGQLMGADPDKEWCEDCAGDGRGCVVETGSFSCFGGESLRMRSIPFVDPSTIADQGSDKQGEISGFVGVFIEKVAGNYAAGGPGPAGLRNVYARLIFESGSGSTNQPGESEESLLRNLQLIE